MLSFMRMFGVLALGAAVSIGATARAIDLPAPAADASLAQSHGSETIVLAGGCFWGIQAVFEHVKGVTRATAGYAGGAADTAQYETVSTGTTGHAESVQVTFDPAQITVGRLLKVYFSVAHDPTELNRQGPDAGTQYRSSIFFTSPEQEKVAHDYVAQLDGAKAFSRPIVTQIVPLKGFYPAEAYHQDYAALHPDQPYIAFYDLPKLAALRKQLPDLYVETATN